MDTKTNSFIVCVFATADTPYVEIANRQIIASLRSHGISHDFEEVPNLGTWQKNTSYKATFALDMLNKHDKNIVLLDADCQVLRYPDLFDNIPEQYNIAAHILDWSTWYQRGDTIKEFLTGTLFLRNTERTKEIVKMWQWECSKSNIWEQKCLANVLMRNQEPVYNLPIGYCWINTMPFGEQPYVKCDDKVIVHYQASRDLKRTLR